MSVINQCLNTKVKPTILENIKNNFNIETDEDFTNITEELKHYFKNIIEEIQTDMTDEPLDLSENMNVGYYNMGESMSMYFKDIDESLLLNAVNKLNNNSAPGPDKIRPKDIKSNIFHLKLILVHSIKRILETGVIPEDLKITNLRPIFKNGSKRHLSCYRPIGRISVIIKILEYYINDQLNTYLRINNIINQTQYGFIKDKSTIGLLEKLTSDINCALNNCNLVIALTTDLTKAFDLVNYDTMLQKLRNIGIGGKLYRFFDDYFKKRKLRVSIGHYMSNTYEQTCGLIQGSILSPSLFNIYVNDLSSIKLNSGLLQC